MLKKKIDFIEKNPKRKEREERLKQLSEELEKLKNDDPSKPSAKTIKDIKIQRPDEYYEQLINEILDKQHSSSLKIDRFK